MMSIGDLEEAFALRNFDAVFDELVKMRESARKMINADGLLEEIAKARKETKALIFEAFRRGQEVMRDRATALDARMHELSIAETEDEEDGPARWRCLRCENVLAPKGEHVTVTQHFCVDCYEAATEAGRFR